MVDGIARPGFVFYNRQFQSHRRDVGPVPLPFRTLIDPLAQAFDLPLGECLAEFGRRHVVICIRRRDAPEQIALLAVAGDDDQLAFVERFEQAALLVEPESGFAFVLVRAVAGETVL